MVIIINIINERIINMTTEHYGESHLYVIASQLSRVIEQDTQEGSIVYCMSKGIRELYDNGICNENVIASLMVQAWKLVLLTELVNETESKELKDIVENKAKDFVDGIDKLDIQNTLRRKLGYNELIRYE